MTTLIPKYEQPGSTTVNRPINLKLQEYVSVKDFGATGNGTTDDTAAIQAAWTWAISNGGARIHLPNGTYLVTSAINITGANNVTFEGDGIDNTIITSNSTTANIFYDSGTSLWRTFRDFSIASSVTRTAGSYFYLTSEKRSQFEKLKLTGHFNGFNFLGFEQCWMSAVSITTPSGASNSIILGTPGTSGSGSNMMLDSLFLRGNNDITQNAPTGLYGLNITDCDAVFAVNCDIGGFVNSDMLINPTVRAANHYFTQCFFDATKSSNCVTMQGAGIKVETTFNGCWFASGGKLTGGSTEACGLRATNNGSYRDIILTGCLFFNNNGTGFLIETPNADFTITGCKFNSNGASGVTNRYGFWLSPATLSGVGPSLTGCVFSTNTPLDAAFTSNSNYYSATGCIFATGISNGSGGGSFSGNIDQSVTSVASATTLVVSPNQTYVNVTGTTNIAGITATFKNHVISLHFNGVLTVIDASTNLQLAGNFITANNSQLTLVCDGATWYEIGRSNN